MSAIALPSEETTSSLSKLTATIPHPDSAADPIANRNSKFANPSTGPRSPQGKQKAAQNAAKHHLSANNPPPHLEENPTYQISKQEFMEEFNPQTPAQCVLVNQLTFTAWKLDQIPHLEHQILSTPLGQTEPAPVDRAQPIDLENYLFDRLSTDEDDDTEQPTKDTTNQITAAHLLQNTATPLTRLWDYHRRLQARFQSLIRQIQQLKRQQQNAREQADKKERQQHQASHDALAQCAEEIHQRNKAREEAARKERQETAQRQARQRDGNNAPAQNERPSPSQISNPNSEIPSPRHSSTSAPPTACCPQPTHSRPPAPAQNELPLAAAAMSTKAESMRMALG